MSNNARGLEDVTSPSHPFHLMYGFPHKVNLNKPRKGHERIAYFRAMANIKADMSTIQLY